MKIKLEPSATRDDFKFKPCTCGGLIMIMRKIGNFAQGRCCECGVGYKQDRISGKRTVSHRGNGTRLRPEFNHSIEMPAKRSERSEPISRSSRMGIINQLEDVGAFDTDAQLAKLRELRKQKAAKPVRRIINKIAY